jgi:hypothetical protein
VSLAVIDFRRSTTPLQRDRMSKKGGSPLRDQTGARDCP